jgi:hypothetical protein
MPENGRKMTENARKTPDNGDFGSDSDSADRETLLFFGESGAEIENLARARSRKKRENGLFRRPKLEFWGRFFLCFFCDFFVIFLIFLIFLIFFFF